MLDQLAALAKERHESNNSFARQFAELETDEVTNCEGHEEYVVKVHVNTGIAKLAEQAGVEYRTTSFSHEYPYRHWFDYGGVEFFQLSRGRVPE